jgi:pimeloyl-ACP methyl ester carboxylesterase
MLVLLVGACVAADPRSSVTPSATGIATETAAQTQGLATAATDPRAPDFAGVFDVGGYSLYLECRGTDGPVVLFDAGSGSDTTSWNRSRKDFIGLVDNSFRRCLYDRANLGKSDRVASSRTSATAAQDLHALLAAAGLPPPYVLVGRSFGGYNVRMFASAYPSEVRGLVLVETLTPEFQDGMLALLTPEQRAGEIASFSGIEPPMDELASGPLVAAAALPDVPLLVVAGTKWHSGNAPWPSDWPGPALDALWDRVQVGLAAAVPRGRLVVFEGGDHSLQFSQPERLAKEINDFLASL